MQGQHLGESLRLGREGLHYSLPEQIAAVQSEHKPRHCSGASCQLPVFGLIWRQAAGGEALRQEDGLAKCEAQPFSGNCVNAAGSIAYKSGSVPDTPAAIFASPKPHLSLLRSAPSLRGD